MEGPLTQSGRETRICNLLLSLSSVIHRYNSSEFWACLYAIWPTREKKAQAAHLTDPQCEWKQPRLHFSEIHTLCKLKTPSKMSMMLDKQLNKCMCCNIKYLKVSVCLCNWPDWPRPVLLSRISEYMIARYIQSSGLSLCWDIYLIK